MTPLKTILCMKWGTAFGADDVNVLYRNCRRHVEGDLRFICLTDNADGFDAAIQTRPIPDIGLSPEDWKRPGVWPKLALYHADLHDLGRVLFIDLDMAIVGDLAQFFEVSEGVTFLNTGESWRAVPRGPGKIAGTGVFSFDPALEAPILQTFQKDPDAAYGEFQNEQDFASAHATSVSYWPEGWVISFKRHLCYRNGIGLFRKPDAPNAATAIVAFHGHPRPSDTRRQLIWGPPPHWHLGKVPWLEAYYEKSGGSDTS